MRVTLDSVSIGHFSMNECQLNEAAWRTLATSKFMLVFLQGRLVCLNFHKHGKLK